MKIPSYPNYRQCNFRTSEKLPSHWKEIRFRYLFNFGRGLGITKANLQDSGIPCISYGEIHSKYGFEVIPEKQDLKCVSETYLSENPGALLQNGDFVFADTSEDIEGSGNFSYLNSDMHTFAGYHTVIVKPVSDVLPRFLAYLFDSLLFRYQIRRTVSGVKVFSITQDILKSSWTWIPSKEEQTQISNFLDYKTAQIDKLIEKKQRLIEKLNEKRIAVITQAVTKGLDSTVPMKDSGVEWLGDIPEHWDVRRLKFMATIQNGRDYKLVECDDGYPVYGSGGVFRQASEYIYDGESVLFGRKGTIDKPLYVNEKFWTVDTMFYSEMQKKTHARYLFYAALTIEYQRLATQTALPSVTQSDLSNYILCYPDTNEQVLIATFLDVEMQKIEKMIWLNTQTISNMQEYRTSLITSAVTGKIDVRNLEIPPKEMG